MKLLGLLCISCLIFFIVAPTVGVAFETIIPNEPNDNQIINQFIDLNSNQQFCIKKNKPGKAWYNDLGLYKEFLHDSKCSTIFSQSPKDFTSDPRSALRKIKDQDWFPFCSPFLSQKYTDQNPKASSSDDALNLAKQFNDNDACNPPPPSKKTTNRYAKAYRPPSQSSLNYRPLNDQEIRKISLLGKTYVTNISSQCCQKNKDCLNLFSNLSIRFCEPQRDPNAEEPCLDGSSFQHSNSGWFSSIFDRHNPGVVQVALFVDKSRGEISDDVDRIFTHELGHACSYIKRKVAINNGNKIVSADLDRYMSADPAVACDASYVGTSAMFDGLYRDLGLSIKSSQCLLSLASKKARFVDRPCENACPRVQLEEAFGNVSEYLFYPDKFVIPYILPNDLVNSYRDSQHPLAADVFKCMVQTPSLLTKYENLTGCKK